MDAHNLLMEGDFKKSMGSLRKDMVESLFKMAHYTTGMTELAREVSSDFKKCKTELGYVKGARDRAQEKAANSVAEANKIRQAADDKILDITNKNNDLTRCRDEQEVKIKTLLANCQSLEQKNKDIEMSYKTKIAELESLEVAKDVKIKDLEAQLQKLRSGEAAQEASFLEARIIAHPSSVVSKPSNGLDVFANLENSLQELRMVKERSDAEYEERIAAASSKAIEEYKASPEFGEYKIELSVQAYNSGVELTRKEILEKYPELDLNFLDEDTPPSSPEGAGSQVP